MNQSRIAALLAPYLGDELSLSSVQLEQISMYIDLLIRWNSRVNLTAVRTPEQIVTRHFGESLFAAHHLFPKSGANAQLPECDAASNPDRSPATERSTTPLTAADTPIELMDIGSGAGFPGLPIKIWSPQTSIALVESNHKKATFLREMIRALDLKGIKVLPQRAQDVPSSSAGTITLRAVEHFSDILPVAVRLLVPGGRLALLIGVSQLPEAQGTHPTLSWSTPVPLPNTKATLLAIARKKP
jgi:16S rRNA (guanine527-N7)-methyltransferase